MNTKIAKMLTEAMGFKYEGYSDGNIAYRYTDPDFSRVIHVRLSPWEFFGKLWEWAQRQEWWYKFWYIGEAYAFYSNEVIALGREFQIIHPDRFADAVYQFLKERQCPVG